MPISEPVTMLTDYALALLCVYFAVAMGKKRATEDARSPPWVLAFLVTAFAAVAGGTAHGFRAPLGDSWTVVWKVTVFSIGLGSALLVAAGVHSALRPHARSESARREGISWMKRAIVVSLAGLAVLAGKLSLHEHFNQNDLYHLIQMAGLYCLYRGALLLRGLVSESGSSRETAR